ncbi:MAG: BMP family ABC transporter substrate-binding protein [Candidatus Tectomicrobia bacterium]|uniref:BMP family ABC transporter substrate-binding protein n=1 Tax=Tectimicrobiota bacterium TaxID=2528274 RepID=A0A937W457_UNCTE|nr:BMP family ABC transporter substrate-binding protein [Candidatus Tectomicrobia bacterium]
MPYDSMLSRRGFLRSAATTVVGLCATTTQALAANPPVVGFIYVGSRDDFGYNQAHAQGAAAVAKLPGIKVVEEEKVPETVDVQKTMGSMITLDGATLLFPTSFGYFDPHVLKVATQYPKVTFLHAGGLYQEGKHPANVSSYFGYIDEAQYLAGVVAGHTSRSGKLGFVAAKPIPQVLRNINAFTLGARTAKPQVTTQVIFTGDWSLPIKEAEATNSLVDQGIDVITCHVDSPKVIVETCERRGIFCSGYHASQASLAPKGYLTGAEWNWESVYTDLVKRFQTGAKIPNLVRGGFKEGMVRLSPYGAAVGEAARQQAEAVRAQFLAGNFSIFKGPLQSNTGTTVVPAGEQRAQTDLSLESMNWLVEGVLGSTK